MTTEKNWKSIFEECCDYLFSKITNDTYLSCSFSGEDTDFLRLNNLKARQVTHVSQGKLNLEMIQFGKRIFAEIVLCRDSKLNKSRMDDIYITLLHSFENFPLDPYIPHYSASGSINECYNNEKIEINQFIDFIESLDI